MARAILERELKGEPARAVAAGRAQFAVAGQADDADIRQLLRENAMSGDISLTLEREPDYFADANLPGETKQTIIARMGGTIACMGSCSIRQRFVNGAPYRVGYLGGLRLDARQAGRFDIVRRGYQFFRETQSPEPADFYFTSIAADNARARQFLESALPGMPLYEFIGEFVTVLLPVGRSSHSGQCDGSLPGDPKTVFPITGEFINCLNDCNRQFQFAPCWEVETVHALQTLGLRPEDYCTLYEENQPIANAALWDQRGFKQIVIRDYSSKLTMARPILNFLARFGGPRLPALGEKLANGFVLHLAVESDRPALMAALMRELNRMGASRGLEYLTLGFDARDPRLAIVRSKSRCREYRTRLYVVR